ncbi:MAG: cytochrome c biogenesis protein CcsA [Planctomycetota bacterium]
MTHANDTLIVFVPMAYLVALGAYLVRKRAPEALDARTPLLATGLALVLHGALLGVRFAMIGQLPWTNVFDVLSALAFLMTLTYALVEAASRVAATGPDLLPMPFLLVVYACAFGPHEPLGNPVTHTSRFVLHTVPAVSAVAALLVSGLYGVLYLRLAKAIKRKDFGPLFQRLPNLEILARMNFWAATIGFLLVTLGIFVGAIIAGDISGGVDVTNPKIAMTYLVWTLLLVPMIGKLTGRWPDRATARISVITVGLIVASILTATVMFLLG